MAECLGPLKCIDVIFDLCRFGCPYKKTTRITTSMPQLAALGKRCTCKTTHVWLRSCVATQKAGAYPTKLCNLWASLLCENLPSDSFGDDLDMSDALDRYIHAAHLRGPQEADRGIDPYEVAAAEFHPTAVFGNHTRQEAARRRRRYEKEIARMESKRSTAHKKGPHVYFSHR